MSKVQQLKAAMDAKIATRSVEQLKDMLALLAETHTPEAAVVRGAIYMRLCDVLGDDAADAIYEAAA